MPPGEIPTLAAGLVVVDTEKGDVWMPAVEAHERGRLRDATSAPGGPEGHDDRPAGEPVEADPLAREQVRPRDGGRRAWRRCGYGAGQRNGERANREASS